MPAPVAAQNARGWLEYVIDASMLHPNHPLPQPDQCVVRPHQSHDNSMRAWHHDLRTDPGACPMPVASPLPRLREGTRYPAVLAGPLRYAELAICWRRRWRQLARLALGLETITIVCAIAKWLVTRRSAAAKRDRLASGDVKFTPLSVLNHELPSDAHRTIVGNRHCCTGHVCSPLVWGYWVPHRFAY